MKALILLLACVAVLGAQTTVNGGRTVKGPWDASGAASTRPNKEGTALPASCAVGETFFKTNEPAGQNLHVCTATNTWTKQSGRYATIGFAVGDGSTVITTGSKGFVVVENACTIDRWTILAKESGSAVVDVKRSTYANFPTTASIVGGGNKPTLSSAQKNQAAPSSWTSVAVAAGDVIEWNVDSASTVTRLHVFLRCY